MLPGVGAFADCRAGLYGVPGMVDALQREVIERGKPFLGICVGMQLMATRGVEYGIHAGLDWIAGRRGAHRARARSHLKIPHMGWNELAELKPHALLDGIAPRDHAYFVHSFQLKASQPETVLAHHRLWRTGHRRRRPRQSRRHAVPSREEPGHRPAADRQLPALEALSSAAQLNFRQYCDYRHNCRDICYCREQMLTSRTLHPQQESSSALYPSADRRGLQHLLLRGPAGLGALLGPALAHAFELPAKIGLPREEYFIVQQIYAAGTCSPGAGGAGHRAAARHTSARANAA